MSQKKAEYYIVYRKDFGLLITKNQYAYHGVTEISGPYKSRYEARKEIQECARLVRLRKYNQNFIPTLTEIAKILNKGI